ncbi:hypothetical protein PUNSTDRAFT_80708 [Punctularia strigosozonata HHB-11173 SS5]|uniref:uncharacterized protein n=1 Tax=Punctularia strigosozonata (strain HHB-11173) TaxID=741275 RepID=UPI000441720F|nr:uncharacterized protein PUNSTDRAFT_80708 [Punctularia strigosozonata HHB-11173 SS5]EIN14387.1 hypothetical protein PUNSTDRAFT_80708 [Punctularia strigosozonata HHB-11173 SS5]
MEVNLQEEQRKGHDLQKIVDSLSAENAELQGASARLAQLEPMLQKAGNLLREEQSRSAGLRQQVSDLETRLQDIPKQLQTIAALEAEKQSLETGLTQQLLAAEARAQSMEESLADERSKSRALQERLSDLETSVRDASALQETIAILVSEKSSLSTQLERLQDTEARAQEVQNLLDQERQKSQALEGRIREMEIEASTSSAEITRLTSNEKELSERCREQERELQRTQAALSGLQAASSESSRRVRELEDQIQNDDTAERLEASLKNTQDRADELEFQLSKLKQAHDALKADREALEAKLRQHSITAEDWIKKHDSLEERNATIQKQLDDITFERDALLQDKAALQTEVDAGHKSAEDVQKLLAQATSDLSASARQLQTAQAELRAALRRAEEAERIQKDLQAEGTQLLRSLDEMRPKVVELSNEKAELMEKADGLDAALKSRDAVIAQLEASLTEAQQQRDETEKRRRSIVATHEKEHASSLQAMSELQKAYTELQTDAEQAYSMVRDFEAQRRNDQQSMARHVEDVDRLTRTVAELEKQLAALQIDLAERGRASEEQQDFLGRTQTEIEFLRGEIAARDDEIEKLRQQQNSDASPTTRKSWNEEMLSATRQQLDLELSASQSRIRELESAVFEAEDRAHGLQKQVNSLQDQLAHSILVHARSASQEGRRPFSPTFAATGPSRPSSRLNHTESRRPSLNMARRSSGTLAPPPRSALDYNMSPETRHKRQVSLNMLKARMDSEAAAASRPGPRAMPPIPAGKSGHALSSVTEADPEQQHSFRKPQFTNESFFWCSSCSGDLLIL